MKNLDGDIRSESPWGQWAAQIRVEGYAIRLAARDPRVPWYAKALAGCFFAYLFNLIDLIPDFIPILGFMDDLLIVPAGLLLVLKLIPPEVMAERRAAARAADSRQVRLVFLNLDG